MARDNAVRVTEPTVQSKKRRPFIKLVDDPQVAFYEQKKRTIAGELSAIISWNKMFIIKLRLEG